MGEYRRYTREELERLRSSPLVQKPDGLPSIEQWMEGSKPKEDATSNPRQKRPSTRPEDALENNPLTRFASGSNLPIRRAAPGVVGRGNAGQGAMGDFSLFPSSSSNDDLSLGPPTMNFTSNSRNVRGTGPKSAGDGGDFQDGFFKVRSAELPKERGAGLVKETRRTREPGQVQQQGEEGWTSVRRRKSSHAEEEKSGGKWDERERGEARRARDAEPLETPLRRNGVGRGGRFTDSTWIRPEGGAEGGERVERGERVVERGVEREQSSTTRGDLRNMSWRDRDAVNKERPAREWTRGRQHDGQHQQAEEDPEWMADDTPATQQGEKNKHTQEDFQRWKEQQRLREHTKSGNAPAAFEREMSEPVDQMSSAAIKPPLPSKSTGVIPTLNKFGFGVFEDSPAQKQEVEKFEVAQRPQPIKSKSRFDQLFKKEEPMPPPLPQADALQFMQAEHASGTDEDRIGFEKILAMLGSKSTPPNAPVARAPPPQAEMPRSVASPNQHLQRSREPLSMEPRQQREFMEEVLANQLGAQGRNQNRQITPGVEEQYLRAQLRMNEMQEMQYQQGGHQGRGRPQDHSDLLLSLMNQRQNPNAQQAHSQRMNEMPDHAGAQYGPSKGGMPNQSQQQQQQQPPHSQAQIMNQRHAPSAPPPGLDAHHQRLLAEQQHQEQMRRQQAHGGPPPGFYDHDGMPGGISGSGPGQLPEGMGGPPPPGLVRRNTSDAAANGGMGVRGAAPAQASNLGIPSMHGVPPGIGRMEQMLMMRNGPGPGGPMPGGPGGHHLPPPGLMSGGVPPQGPGNSLSPSGPGSSGAGNMPNGGNASGNGMRGPPGGPGSMGPLPGFQGGMLPLGIGGGGPMPPMNMNVNMQGMGPGNGPPMPPGFPQMGPPPPGFFGGPMGPGGPNAPMPGGPGMGPGGPGMPPPGAFFGGRFPPGFEAEMGRQVPQGRGF